MQIISIGIVDDHKLFSKSLSLLLNSFADFKVTLEASNGVDLQEKISSGEALPDILLVDVAMPVMDGIQTTKWLSKNHPTIKLVALSVSNEERTIINMLRAGCCCYLFKDTNPDELEIALRQVYETGYYNSEAERLSFKKLITPLVVKGNTITLTEKEMEFLQFACSDMPYKEIAIRMGISERTTDGYRQILFTKFRVQSRTGMAIEAIRQGLVKFS